jgi:hypothetical protein
MGELIVKIFHLIFDDYFSINAENVFTNEYLIFDFNYENNFPEKQI